MDDWHFISSVNLIIHEAGHWIFFIFGDFLYIAGGSLMQLIMPSLFIVYFFGTEQKYSGSLMFYWLAINFFSVAQYAGDSIVMQLPLLGGDGAIHDWNQLLTTMGILKDTKIVADIIYTLGILSIIAGLYFSFQAFLYSKRLADRIIL